MNGVSNQVNTPGVSGENPIAGGVGVSGTSVHASICFEVLPVAKPPQEVDAYKAVRAVMEHGVGVKGDTDATGATGVVGLSQSGLGVYGASLNSSGVQGMSGYFDAVVGETNSPAHAGVTGRNLTTGANGGVGIYGVGGQYAGKFDGNVQVNGTLTAVDVILPAADCAEEFDVGTAGDVEPGTVMVLNEEGGLEPSRESYDKKVAGVISGAGDYRPGLILDRRDSSQKRMPLALLGKAFCKVDAQYAPVEVGDLLTTSPTLGHAMRAADPLKAFGAVIGKALRPLRSGQGLVPILIALQ